MQAFLVLGLRAGHSRLQWSLVKNCSRYMGFDSFYFILPFVLEAAGCKLLSEDLSAFQIYITQKKTSSQDEENKEGGLLSMRQNSERCVRTITLACEQGKHFCSLCVYLVRGPPTFNLKNRGINGRQRHPKNRAICRHTLLSFLSTLGIPWRSSKHYPVRLNCTALWDLINSHHPTVMRTSHINSGHSIVASFLMPRSCLLGFNQLVPVKDNV